MNKTIFMICHKWIPTGTGPCMLIKAMNTELVFCILVVNAGTTVY
jgi:hypothetical protein